MSAVYPSLRGKSVFITGGGSGIGACLTEGFARQGSRVAFIDIAEPASQALVERLEKDGLPRPWYRKTDVTNIPELQGAIRDAAPSANCRPVDSTAPQRAAVSILPPSAPASGVIRTVTAIDV